MNGGMFPGMQLNAEPLEGNKVGMEVVTTSGIYITKGPNLEIALQGSGASGTSRGAGGNSGAIAIKRIIGLPIGTQIAVLIPDGGVYINNSYGVGSAAICSIPGYPQIIANGGQGGTTVATAVGGDLNIASMFAGVIDQNGSGGAGASSLVFGPGGPANSPGRAGIGYGSGGGTGTGVGDPGGDGAKGAMLVRYF